MKLYTRRGREWYLDIALVQQQDIVLVQKQNLVLVQHTRYERVVFKSKLWFLSTNSTYKNDNHDNDDADNTTTNNNDDNDGGDNDNNILSELWNTWDSSGLGESCPTPERTLLLSRYRARTLLGRT